jgi:hypothetical protein
MVESAKIVSLPNQSSGNDRTKPYLPFEKPSTGDRISMGKSELENAIGRRGQILNGSACWAAEKKADRWYSAATQIAHF